MPCCTARIAAMRPRGEARLVSGDAIRRAVGQAEPAHDAGDQLLVVDRQSGHGPSPGPPGPDPDAPDDVRVAHRGVAAQTPF